MNAICQSCPLSNVLRPFHFILLSKCQQAEGCVSLTLATSTSILAPRPHPSFGAHCLFDRQRQNHTHTSTYTHRSILQTRPGKPDGEPGQIKGGGTYDIVVISTSISNNETTSSGAHASFAPTHNTRKKLLLGLPNLSVCAFLSTCLPACLPTHCSVEYGYRLLSTSCRLWIGPSAPPTPFNSASHTRTPYSVPPATNHRVTTICVSSSPAPHLSSFPQRRQSLQSAHSNCESLDNLYDLLLSRESAPARAKTGSPSWRLQSNLILLLRRRHTTNLDQTSATHNLPMRTRTRRRLLLPGRGVCNGGYPSSGPGPSSPQ